MAKSTDVISCRNIDIQLCLNVSQVCFARKFDPTALHLGLFPSYTVFDRPQVIVGVRDLYGGVT